MNLIVNGKEHSVEDGMNVQDLIEYFKLDTKFVAVGYNGDVVKKENYHSVVLVDGDRIELVKPVGGG